MGEIDRAHRVTLSGLKRRRAGRAEIQEEKK
jgi:hypothetical protein